MARGLNGTSQYLSAPDNATLQVPFPIAVGMWFKGGAQGNFKYLLSKVCVAGQFASYGLSTQGTGDLRFSIAYATGAGTLTNSPTAAAATVFDNAWHHLLGTYDGANVRLYVDGVEAGSGTAETRAIVYTNLSLYLGSFDGTQLYTAGSMAEVAIWKSIPDAAERVALAKGYSPLLIRPRDLATYWPLVGKYSPEIDVKSAINLTVSAATTDPHPRTFRRVRPLWIPPAPTGGGTTFTQSVSGSATPTSAVVKQARKPVSGAVTAAGALAKSIGRTLAGSVTPAGAVSVTKVVLLALAGTLTASGALVRRAGKALAGSVSPAGTVTKSATRTLTGATMPAGAVTKQTTKTFAGSTTPSGSLIKTVGKTLAGTVSAAGALAKRTTKTLAGSVASIGSLTASGGSQSQPSGVGPRIVSRTETSRITSRTTGGHL